VNHPSSSTLSIDTGVLAVLRIYTAVLWLIMASTCVAFLEHDAPEHAPGAMWSMLALTTLLMVLLLWTRFARRLGAAYLPTVILLLSCVPFVGETLGLRQTTAAYDKLALELSLVLLVPLFVCAWQYGLRSALLLALTAGVVDLGLSVMSPMDANRAEVYRHVLLSRTIAFVIAAYITARLVKEQRAQHHSLWQANARLASYAMTLEQLATSRERNRVAREIHDTLAHTLSALVIQLEAIRALWTANPSDARSTLDRSLAVARSGLTETRRALQALRASPLEDMGLVLAVRNLAEAAASRGALELDLDLPAETLTLPAAFEHGVYRIVEESLENSVRHAGAHRIAVRMQHAGGRLLVSVADDGCGFDTSTASEGVLGIHGMVERARMLGGALDVQSAAGQGTKVTFTVHTPRAELGQAAKEDQVPGGPA